MSLKSRKSIDMAGPENHKETTTSFKKNQDGTYTKVVKETIRDWKTNQIKKGKLNPIESGPYILTIDKEEADEVVAYEDIDMSIKYMYFKLLQLDELAAEDEI